MGSEQDSGDQGAVSVLGLAGSPRRQGNTDLLLDAALSGAADGGAKIEKIVLNRLKIRPCQHCDGCINTGVCIVKDDMPAMHRKLKEADHIVLSSPIFFMGVTAQTKAFIDRCQALWVAKYLLKQRNTHTGAGQRRQGVFMSASGMTRPDVFLGAIMTAKAFFATCDVAYAAEILFPGIDARGDIRLHPTALDEAYSVGASLVPASEKTKAALAP